MILVVAGLHERPFDRLMKAVARLDLEESMVVQRGSSRVEVPQAKTFASLETGRLQQAYKQARLVIGQASPGVLFDSLDAGKRPILVPRQAGFGEHVDNHQVDFARFVQDRARIVWDVEELPAVVAGWPAQGLPGEAAPVCEEVVRDIGRIVEATAKTPGRGARATWRLWGRR